MLTINITEYNPRYFDQPNEYRPSRWYEVSNESEAFSAFSIGKPVPITESCHTIANLFYATVS